MEISKQEKKRRTNGDGRGEHKKKIAALEARSKDQELKISSLSSATQNNNSSIDLPPPPNGNPLQPPTGFTHRGGSRN